MDSAPRLALRNLQKMYCPVVRSHTRHRTKLGETPICFGADLILQTWKIRSWSFSANCADLFTIWMTRVKTVFIPWAFLLDESRVQTAKLMISTKDPCVVLQRNLPKFAFKPNNPRFCLVFVIATWQSDIRWCHLQPDSERVTALYSPKQSPFLPIKSKAQLSVVSAEAYTRIYMF